LTDELGGRFAILVLLGAENALGNEQMSVLLCDARGDAIRRRHYIGTLLARQVDGLIVVGETNDVRPSISGDIPVPVVYVYGESDDPGDLSIVADDHGGVRLAADHLVALGRRAIGHITCEETYRAARARAVGLRAVLDEAGLPLPGRPALRGVDPALGPARRPRAAGGAPGNRRDLLRQRPDRDRRRRHHPRAGPADPRRHRPGRLRQLGGVRQVAVRRLVVRESAGPPAVRGGWSPDRPASSAVPAGAGR
jgi:hypothetical protein